MEIIRRHTAEELSLPASRRHWPQEFKKGRIFNRQTENESYIAYIQHVTNLLDLEDEDEDEGEEGWSEIGHDLSHYEDEVSNYTDETENEDEKANYHINTDLQAGLSRGNVRIFMTGLTDEVDKLPYRDQVEQVSSFCESALWEIDEGTTDQKRNLVALLDDRNDLGSAVIKRGKSRPYRGPLTSQELGVELSKKRLSVGLNPFNPGDEGESDAERRLIYIANPDASSIDTIARTASCSQAPALKNLFYRYLMSKIFVGVTIPSFGFLIFTLEFSIPFYALRSNGRLEVLQDDRRKGDGTPLRQKWPWPSLSGTVNSSRTTDKVDSEYSLYEAQISVAITGIDDSIWTAYGFVDTFCRSEESVIGYHQQTGEGGRPDPLAAGNINANSPIWTPRQYFLKVFEIRINQVLIEWNLIVDMMENEVERSTDHKFQIPSDDPRARQHAREFSMWNFQMLKLLKRVIRRISDTISAWEDFRFHRKEIDYFLFASGDSGVASSTSLKSSITAIDKSFSNLSTLCRRMREFEKELETYDDKSRYLYSHPSLESDKSVAVQPKPSANVRKLSLITKGPGFLRETIQQRDRNQAYLNSMMKST